MDSVTLSPKSTDYILVAIAIVGLAISIVLSIFFSFIPIQQIKTQFDETAAQVNAAVINVNKIARELQISSQQTLDTLSRLDRFEQGVCKDIGNLLPTFCGL